MAGVAVLAAALTTPVTSTLKVFAGGADITGDVKWNTFTVTDSGTNAKGTASMTIEAAASGFASITDQAMLRVEEPANTAAPEVFRGFIRARRPGKDPRHPTLELIADDISTLLDDAFIPVELRRPETMQARIGYLWGQYAGQFLSGDLSFVLSVGSTLPLQRFEAVTLRQAIEMTIAQASSNADYYVDMLGRLHVFTSETNNAPFSINADSPGGGAISPEMLDVEFDSQSYANRVYVKGATPDASLHVQDEAAIAAANGLVRTAVVQAGDVTTATMARAIGNMYLGRVKNAKPRGVFVTSSPDDGWRGGQNVTVTSADHAISGQTYKIARVTQKVLVPGTNMKRQYRVEFGGATAGAGIDGQLPIIAGASSGVYMLDQLSTSLVSAAANAATGGIGPSLRRYIMSGVYNGDFYGPPPGPDAPIDDTTNPLPYWTFTQSSGTAVTATAVLDSATGSGRKIRFDMASGAAGDEGYLEQIVAVNSTTGQNWLCAPRATVKTDFTVNNMVVFIESQYLTVDAVTTTGTGASTTATTTAIGASTVRDMGNVPANGAAPADAYWLRVRIGFRRGAEANGSSGSVFLHEVRNVQGPDGLRFPDAVDPSTYNYGRIIQYNGGLEILPVAGAGSSKSVNLGGDSGVMQTTRVRHTPQGAIAIRTTNQALTTGTWTAIQLNDTDISDVFGFHDPASNNTRFTIPSGWGGTYLCVGTVAFASGGTGERFVGWSINGGGTTSPDTFDMDRRATTTAGNALICHMTSVLELSAGDYVELMAWHNQGVNLNATGRGAVFYLGERV